MFRDFREMGPRQAQVIHSIDLFSYFSKEQKLNSREKKKAIAILIVEGFFPGGRPASYVLVQPKEFNQGLPRTNLAVGQSGTWTQDTGISVRHPSHSARRTLRLNFFNETIQTYWRHHNVNELRLRSLKSNDTHLFFGVWEKARMVDWWSLALSAPEQWNKLLYDIRSCENLSLFKT